MIKVLAKLISRVPLKTLNSILDGFYYYYLGLPPVGKSKADMGEDKE